MKKIFKNMKENEKGFTLIELIVVIAIIGILAAVLLPKFSGFTDSARKKSVLSEAKSVYTAYAAVQADKGTVTNIELATYLGKLPQGVLAAGITITAVDPVIVYTTKVSGKDYLINIAEGGAISIKGPETGAVMTLQ